VPIAFDSGVQELIILPVLISYLDAVLVEPTDVYQSSASTPLPANTISTTWRNKRQQYSLHARYQYLRNSCLSNGGDQVVVEAFSLMAGVIELQRICTHELLAFGGICKEPLEILVGIVDIVACQLLRYAKDPSGATNK
jgi:hypothetical protein